MIAALVGLSFLSTAKWSAKFVPHEQFGTHMCVLDCRRDLSLVGYGYTLMMDNMPCTPMAIIRGHVAEDEREVNERLWGFRITKSGYDSAKCEYPLFGRLDQIKKWNPKAVSVAFPGSRVSKLMSKVPKNPKVTDGLTPATQESLSTFPVDLKPELVRRDEKLFDPGVTVQWLGPKSSVRVGNGNYQPVTPGSPDMRMHDSDRTIAVVKAHGRIFPLSAFVSNAKDLLFDEVVWLSNDGWFVCRGSRDGEQGLFWLYPIH